MPIARTPWIDDDGSGTTGTILNNAEKQQLYNEIDASAAFVNAANTFVAGVQTVSLANPQMNVIDTAAAANARVYNIWSSAGGFYIRALNDALNVQQSVPLRLDRAGHAYVEGNIYEKSRGNPIGHWIDTAFNAANYTTDAGSWTGITQYVNAYTLIGKTLTLSVYVNGTIAGSPVRLSVALPPGMSAARQHMSQCSYSGPVAGTGVSELLQGGVKLNLLSALNGAAWTNGNYFIGATVTFSLP